MTELFASEDTAPKGYRVLARKYRPSGFEDLIGQEAMVRTLTNAINAGRLPQAWMLTGVRGIGKTTTARIIARALNCTGADGKGGATVSPCGVCDNCKSIAEDRHVDVQELDAASRTSVDDIREIIEGVRYAPVSARYKIYILDEIHMLSKNAFNALLKTLEEPPPHVKFIFATTEIRKVPVTVLSRCQRFDLRRIDAATLFGHFSKIAEKEKVNAEAEAIRLIALAADGSVRDGLSLLDQAIARGNGEVKEADVKDMLGLANRAQSIALCENLFRGKMREALGVFDSMIAAGADAMQLLQELAELTHLLTRAQIMPDMLSSDGIAEAERELMARLKDVKIPALSRSWQILLKGIGETQASQRPAEAAEMVLIRMAYAAELPTPSDLVRKYQETKPATQIASQPAAKAAPEKPRPISSGNAALDIRENPNTAQTAAPSSMPSSFREIVALFEENREGALHAQLYGNVHPVRCEKGLLEIKLKPGCPTNLASRVGQCLTQWTGQRWMISVVDKEGFPTLEDEAKTAERKRREKAMSHPLMQTTMLAFPDAKLLSLKQKPASAETGEGDEEIAVTDFEEENRK